MQGFKRFSVSLQYIVPLTTKPCSPVSTVCSISKIDNILVLVVSGRLITTGCPLTKSIILIVYVQVSEQKHNITNHGWVNGETLRTYWKDADIWFYPCTFQETCCLTAYEAAASKTLAVTNNLAALGESVGDRGVIVEGDPRDPKVQDEFIKSIRK